MLNRRTFLATTAAGAVAHFAGAASAQPAGGASAELKALMDHVYYNIVLGDPEDATSLGGDKGARAHLKHELRDRSAEGYAKRRDGVRAALRRLEAIDRSQLSRAEAIDRDTIQYYYGNIVGAYDSFEYGIHSWPEPHAISQLGGMYRSTPDFLASQHKIATRDDAEAYLDRLSAFATQMDNETAQLRREHAIGVIPPDFVITRTGELFDAALRPAPADSNLTRSLATRAKEKGIDGDWAGRAAAIVEKQVYPAMRRQAEAMREPLAKAGHDGGVWRLPKGEEYYAYALRYATTTDMSADEIHKLGLDQMAELSARADEILKAQGMTRGTVAERIRGMNKDRRFLYPNTEAGKAKLIADLNGQMIAIQKRLPEMFGRLPKTPVEIRRVPVEIEAGATGGYYTIPAPDGSRPGAYYINLRDTAETPSWTLPTLTYHEAAPGHHLQIALAQESSGIHPLRRLPMFSVYSEGWGLYAEQVADELGAYENDPFGKIGYLNSYMFRAARLVVDTGLHHKRWSVEQAHRYMTSNLGDHERSLLTEVERYCVWPGQATSYKVGQTRWLGLRENAKARLGDRFDIKGFHDTALAAGTIPLAVLERVMNDWVRAQLG